MASTTSRTLRAVVTVAFLTVVPLVALLGTAQQRSAVSLLDHLGWSSRSGRDKEVTSQKLRSPSAPIPLSPLTPATVSSLDAASPQDNSFEYNGPASRTAAPYREAPPGSEIAENVRSESTVVHDTAPGRWESATPIRLPKPAPATRRFTTIQQRLRQLGATYYRLETWGTDGQTYRFLCYMALPGADHYARPFEVVDSNALVAMERVLAEIEAWKSATRLPTR